VSTVLVTGASGFIGRRLVERLKESHTVVALSRTAVTIDAVETIVGDFANPHDLAQLDALAIDTVVHLGGVTGDANEEDAITVNVAGSRRLFRHLIEVGVRHFVVASSIAAVGCLTPDFLPRELPIPDEHPCDSANIYGVSKYFIEELARYFVRVEPELEFELLRLGAVIADDAPPIDLEGLDSMTIPFCQLGAIAAAVAVEGFAVAAENPLGAGLRIMNLVAPMARTPLPTADSIRRVLGSRADGLNLSAFDQPGHEFDGIYSVQRIRELYGFTAQADLRG
jgi:UDP-glucose 4-epimerase